MLNLFKAVQFDDGENFYQATQVRCISKRGKWSMQWRVDKQSGHSWISISNKNFKTLEAVRRFLKKLTGKKVIHQNGLT